MRILPSARQQPLPVPDEVLRSMRMPGAGLPSGKGGIVLTHCVAATNESGTLRVSNPFPGDRRGQDTFAQELIEAAQGSC